MAFTRKNALFAGHQVGADNWAMLASLIATCKMSAANYGNPAIGEPLAAFAQASPGSELETLS